MGKGPLKTDMGRFFFRDHTFFFARTRSPAGANAGESDENTNDFSRSGRARTDPAPTHPEGA